MAYDTALAERVRDLLGRAQRVTEREMFGGIAFMIDGNMAVGVTGDDLMVRVGKEAHDEATARSGASAMEMGTRPMIGWIRVSPDVLGSEEELSAWVTRGADYARTLPPK